MRLFSTKNFFLFPGMGSSGSGHSMGSAGMGNMPGSGSSLSHSMGSVGGPHSMTSSVGPAASFMSVAQPSKPGQQSQPTPQQLFNMQSLNIGTSQYQSNASMSAAYVGAKPSGPPPPQQPQPKAVLGTLRSQQGKHH